MVRPLQNRNGDDFYELFAGAAVVRWHLSTIVLWNSVWYGALDYIFIILRVPQQLYDLDDSNSVGDVYHIGDWC